VTLSPVQQELAITVVKVLVLFNALLGLFSVMTWAERRLLAFMQFRLGPNRTGPIGIFQPVADGIKLFFKEELIPAGANKWVFVAAPALAVFTAFLSIAVVPYGGTITLPRFAWMPGLAAGPRDRPADRRPRRRPPLHLRDLVAGRVRDRDGGLGGRQQVHPPRRAALVAQMFSYELSLGLSWVGVILLAGSFRIHDIVAAQAGPYGLAHWNFIRQILGFLVYLVAATAEVNRTPFDLPEAETELVAGFHTEYSSMRFALLQMAEYVNMITVAAVGANLFFGGWLSPVPFLPDSPLWFFAKMFAGLFFFIWLRGTLPRLRYDQLMAFGWKVLVPLATLNILVTAAWVTFVPPGWPFR
jgi:NADH-quinone oxidoreductase subunit H